jgi:hypothetical protein
MSDIIAFPRKSESVAAHCDAMNDIQMRLKSFKPEDRLVLLAGCLGSCLCELGEKPSRAMAISGIGLAVEAMLDMVHRTYDDVGVFR